MRRFRILLAAALAAVVLGTLAAYWLNPPAKLQVKEDPNAAIMDEDGRPYVKGLTYTQVRDGLKRWTLTAKGARYDDASGHVTLVKVKVDWFPEKGGLMTIRGDEGEYDQHNQVVILRGNVRGQTHDGVKLKAEYLTYSEREQMVESDSWVTLSGTRFSVTGKGVVGVMPQSTLVFKSQVDSTFLPSGQGPPPGATVGDSDPEPKEGGKR
jgi:LPS export ABC transporter protein LptC